MLVFCFCFVFFQVTTGMRRVISIWIPVKFEFHSWTRFAHYASYFINWLWRKHLQRAPVPTAENCKTAGCTSLLGHKPAWFPESLGETIAFMKKIRKYFLISTHVQCTMGQTRRQRRYFTVAEYMAALLGKEMAEAAISVVLHLFCLSLALESWPCSLPHQSSSTPPTTTLAPGQLLPPYLHVSCPRTSTTSSSHIPHHKLLSLPPSAHREWINKSDRIQLTLFRASRVCLHRLLVLGRVYLLRSAAAPHLQWVHASHVGNHRAKAT